MKKDEDASVELVDQLIADGLRSAFKTFGLEGTEDKIKEIYARSPKMLDRYISVYNRLIKGR